MTDIQRLHLQGAASDAQTVEARARYASVDELRDSVMLLAKGIQEIVSAIESHERELKKQREA